MSNIDMEKSRMWDELMDHGVILQDTVDKIKHKYPTNKEQVGELLWYLKKCGVQEYDKFLYCLSETGHAHVAKTLWGKEPVFSGQATSGDIIRKMGQLSLQEAPEYKVKHRQYSPESYHTVFEKAHGPEDILCFPRYTGPCQYVHRRRRKYEPVLLHHYLGVPDVYHFQSIFCQQIERIRSIYNEVNDGTFRVNGRFGKIYMFDDPPQRRDTMTVEEFFQMGDRPGVPGHRECVFRSAFKPMAIRHDVLKDYLCRRGYVLIESEPRSMVRFTPKRGHEYIVVLDGDCRFIEFRKPSISWLMIDVKRYKGIRRDLRLDIKSILPVTEEDPRAERFRNTKVLEYIGNRIIVQPEFVEECQFVRRKVTHKFRLPDGASVQNVEEVQLVETQENFMKPHEQDFSGKYPWRDEVVLVCSLPDLNDIKAMERFPENFLRFCNDLENAAMSRV